MIWYQITGLEQEHVGTDVSGLEMASYNIYLPVLDRVRYQISLYNGKCTMLKDGYEVNSNVEKKR
jgi:hypothetical protein